MFDIRSVSVDWIYYSYRYPAHWRIPPPLQAKWLLFAGSVRLCSAGGGRRRSAVQKIINNSSHVLRGLLPPPTTAKQQYNLRRRPHDRQMPDHTGHLADKNFLIRIRILFKDSY